MCDISVKCALPFTHIDTVISTGIRIQLILCLVFFAVAAEVPVGDALSPPSGVRVSVHRLRWTECICSESIYHWPLATQLVARGKLCRPREERGRFLFFFVSLFLLTQRLCWWATSSCFVPHQFQIFTPAATMSRYWILVFYLLRYHQRKTIMCRHVAKRPCPVSDSVAVAPYRRRVRR